MARGRLWTASPLIEQVEDAGKAFHDDGRLQYARAIKISSTPAAPVKIQGRKLFGWSIGAFRIVSFSALRRSTTSASAAPVGLDHAQRAQPFVAPALSSSSSPMPK